MVYDELSDLRADLDGTDDQALKELLERVAAIEQLTTHPGWPFFVDYLKALTAQTQRYVLDGACDDMASYKQRVGFVRGLTEAMNAPVVLNERIRRLQEARDQQ